MYFSVNPKKFSFLTPSYLLKVNKFLIKISQFEFLVITEKNIFAHKLFFFITRPLSQQPHSNSWGPVKPPSPPHFENLAAGSTPPPTKEGGYTLYAICPFLTDAFLNVCGTMSVPMLTSPLQICHLKLVNFLAGRSVAWIYP